MPNSKIISFGLISAFSAMALIGWLPAQAEDLPDWNPVTIDISAPYRNILNDGHASWYVHPRYRNVLMAASTQYPKGTKVKVTNLKNNKSVIVVIKDYGPDPIRHPDRVIDLNKIAFQKIASVRTGIIDVRVELIPTSTVVILK